MYLVMYLVIYLVIYLLVYLGMYLGMYLVMYLVIYLVMYSGDQFISQDLDNTLIHGRKHTPDLPEETSTCELQTSQFT